MCKIILIGASGFVGSAILTEALNRDIKVTAIVRNPANLKIMDLHLGVVKADTANEDLIAEISKGADAIISAYNPGWSNPNIYEETLKTNAAILSAAKKSGVKRILFVGGAGTLFVSPGVRLIDSGAIPNEIIDGVKSLGEFYLNTLADEKEIDWVFFSPAADIHHGERTGRYRLGKDDMIVDENGNSSISVEDYAKAMIDEFEFPRHHNQRFTIGY